MAGLETTKEKINSVLFCISLSFHYLCRRYGQNEDERHVAQECGAAVETD